MVLGLGDGAGGEEVWGVGGVGGGKNCSNGMGSSRKIISYVSSSSRHEIGQDQPEAAHKSAAKTGPKTRLTQRAYPIGIIPY